MNRLKRWYLYFVEYLGSGITAIAGQSPCCAATEARVEDKYQSLVGEAKHMVYWDGLCQICKNVQHLAGCPVGGLQRILRELERSE